MPKSISYECVCFIKPRICPFNIMWVHFLNSSLILLLLLLHHSQTKERSAVPLKLWMVFEDRLPPWKPVGVWLGWMTWERDGGRRTDEFWFFCTTPPVKHKSQAWFNSLIKLFSRGAFCQVSLEICVKIWFKLYGLRHIYNRNVIYNTN